MESGKVIFGSSYPIDTALLGDHRVLAYDPTDDKNKAIRLDDLKNFVTVGNTELVDPGSFSQGSPTSSSLTGVSFTVLGNPFVGISKNFTTGGTPSAGNRRWEEYYGDISGDIIYSSGVEAPNPIKPVQPADTVLIRSILRNDDGEVQEVKPGSDFPTNRYSAQVTASATGLYSKIAEFSVTDGTYAFGFVYGTHSSNPGTIEVESSVGVLKVSIFVDAGAVQFAAVRDSNVVSDIGDFVLQETVGGGVVELYHKANAYWDRIQFAVPFTMNTVTPVDFVSNNSYGALPGSPTFEVLSQPDHLDQPSSGSEIRFDIPRVYGSVGSPLTDTTLTENNLRSKALEVTIFQQGASLTVPASWNLSSNSSAHDSVNLNIIKVKHYTNSYKVYSIEQA